MSIESVLSIIGCPVCHHALVLAQHQLNCVSCGQSYKMVDNIPVLIPPHSGEEISDQ